MSLIGLKVWPPARHSNRLHLKLATEILSSRWVHCIDDWTPDWGVQAEEWKFWSFLHELNCLLSEYSQARGLWSGYEAAQSYSESICWMLLPRLISAGAGDTHSLHWLLCSWKWKRWGSGWECCLLRLSGVRKLTNHHHQDQHTFPTTPPCSSSLQQSAELLHSKRFHICSAAVTAFILTFILSYFEMLRTGRTLRTSWIHEIIYHRLISLKATAFLVFR